MLALGLLAAAPAGAQEPPPEAVLAELPFLEGDARHPSVVRIDLAPEGRARSLPFQLDTGANVSVVSAGAARAMGVRTRRLKTTPYRRRTVLDRDVQFYVDTRRSDAFATGGMEYGVLGGDFLARYVVEIDYPRRRVRFLDPDRFRVDASSPGPGAVVLPLRVASNRPAARIGVGEERIVVLVDTGWEAGLTLSGDVAQRAGIASTPTELGMRGANGPIPTELGSAGEVRLGELVLRDVPVVVLPHGAYGVGFHGDNILGAEVLSQFVVRLDYPRQRLWLGRPAEGGAGERPSPDAAPTPPPPPAPGPS